jgi:hypothetical protein
LRRDRKQEIRDEKAIAAAWEAINTPDDDARDRAILAAAKSEHKAVRQWVEAKFSATLEALRRTE